MSIFFEANGIHECLINSYGRKIASKETEYIAQIIKHQRLQLDYTLQEASEGICCVSYLSKLENLNVPIINEDFLPLLCERLEINSTLENSFISEETLSMAFKAYFTQKYDRLEEIYDKMNAPLFTAGSGIITCFHLLLKKDYKGVKDIFSSLDVIKCSMKFIEAALFIYLVSEYAIGLNNYKESLAYLSNLDDIIIRDNYLNCAIFENNIISAFNLRDDIRFMHYYNKLKNLNFLGYPNNHNLIIQSMYDTYIARSFNIVSRDNFSQIDYDLLDGDIIDKMKYYLLLSDIEINYNDPEGLKKIFDKFVKEEPSLVKMPLFISLLAYICYLINELEYYEMLNNIRLNGIIDTYNSLEVKFINFILLYSSQADNEEFIEYAKASCISNLDNEQNYVYTYVFKECYEQALLVLNKYRDVCLLEKDFKSTSHIKDRRIYGLHL